MASVPAVIRSLEDTALTLLGRSSAADAETARGLLETALRYRAVREDMRREREPEEAEAPQEVGEVAVMTVSAPSPPEATAPSARWLQDASLKHLARADGDGWVAWADLYDWAGRNPISALRSLERRGLVECDRIGGAGAWRITDAGRARLAEEVGDRG